MPKIIDHVLERKEQIVADIKEAEANQLLAQAAVLGGIQSKAWRTYMEQFCDKGVNGVDEAQIARLTVVDAANAPFNKNRAYMVSNGMCGDFSKDHFEENVASIDDGLNQTGCTPTPV